MSYTAAGFSLLSMYQGYLGAEAEKQGHLAQADEFELMAVQTDITRKFNWQQRNARTKQLQINTMQSGMDKAAMAGLQGHKTTENIRADIGGSGVALGGGTANEVIANQPIQKANTQLAIMQGTEQRMDSIFQNAVAVNKMEDFKANMAISNYKRKAARSRKTAETAFMLGMFNAFSSAATTYKATGGDYSTDSFADFNDTIFYDDPNSGWYDTWNHGTHYPHKAGPLPGQDNTYLRGQHRL